MATLSFHALPPSSVLGSDTIIFVGCKEQILSDFNNGLFERFLGPLAEHQKQIFSHLFQITKPRKDSEILKELFCTTQQDQVVRVGLGFLPTACSRHNSPARPHSITKLLKSFSTNEVKTIVLLLSDPSHAYAAGCSVPRAFYLFNTSSSQEVNVYFNYSSDVLPENLVTRILHSSNAIRMAAKLVDMPTNLLYTDTMVEEAARVAQSTGAQLTVIRGEELRERGFGGIYGVGRAAEHGPAFVLLSYFPQSTAPGTPSIVWVGKGIVYDTGGLSMKEPTTMVGMKRDMGGAAAMLSAFEAMVHIGCRVPLHAILCVAENSVGPNATRPDDVHTMYSGKTVEINNTDAEGRLVLADGVSFAVKHLNPRVLIDMATLTGAQGISTGKNVGAVYTNSEDLELTAIQAGRQSGDLVHPLPYIPEFYRPEFSSSMADMKNSVANRSNAQSACAGQFIANHLGEFEETGQWLHIDMAATVKDGERATGYGVALLLELMEHL